METREDIEAMRVVDLREFLRRHGRPAKPVMRESGTPGPMRKTELLAVALEIHDDYVSGKPIHISPEQTDAADSPPNPFQSGLPSPPDRRHSVQVPPRDEPRPMEHTADQAPEKKAAKARRRSAAYVNPAFLEQLRSPTPAKPSEPVSSEPVIPRARPIAPRPALDSASQTSALLDAQSAPPPPPKAASRVVPPPSPRKPPQRVSQRAPPVRPTTPASRVPQQPSAKTVSGSTPKSSRPMTPRRIASRKAPGAGRQLSYDPSRAAPKRVVDDPPPTPPASKPFARSKAAGRASSSAAAEQRKLVLDVDEDYISEEDPDYDAEGEDADVEDLDFDDDVEIMDDGGPTRSDPRYSDWPYEQFNGRSKKQRGTDPVIQEDIPFDSDFVESDHVGESDPGSTVETEDEGHDARFKTMSIADLRAWLKAHGLKYRVNARRDELASLARAHTLHMEATAENDVDKTRRQPSPEEDSIMPVRARTTNARRRRVISAPSPDEENETEIRPGRVSEIKARSGHRDGTGMLVYSAKPKQAQPRRRPVFAFLLLMALCAFLLNSGWNAVFTFRKHLTMVFCDTGATTTVFENGMECRPCPKNGECVGGKLRCDSGYVEIRGKCLEDQEFNVFAEKLAYGAFEVLSELAGRAECGEDVAKVISQEGLGSAMRTLYAGRARRRRQRFDDERFTSAMERAVQTLLEDDTFDVSVSEAGYLSSNSPTYSLKCRLRRKLWEYWRVISTVIGLVIYAMYLKVRSYFRRIHEERVDDAHSRALEYLRDQSNGFRNKEEDVAFVADVMLREEIVGRPTRENVKFWKEVEQRLNKDARVIRKHQVINGMPSYTFEYVGSRRSSGGRNSGSFFDSQSRRSSFGSRASLDSFDLGSDRSGTAPPRTGTFFGFLRRLLTQETE